MHSEWAKHTPGPWAIEPGDPLCVWEFDPKRSLSDRYVVPLAECRTDAGRRWGRELQRPEAAANARLIAAAPRLLEELQRLVNIADSGLFRDRAELSIATHPAYDDARELIKSIIGETK